jgi:hypothetical protein
VRLRLRNALSPLLDPGFLEAVLLRHFEPLFDSSFDEVLSPHYPRPIRFEINGDPIGRSTPRGDSAVLQIRLGRKRKPAAFGYLFRSEAALPEDQQGLAISTFGKVIKRGWDWLGFSPAEAERIAGIIEVPELASCLTLDKADFIRAGTRGGLYLGVRKALQQAVSAQLAVWGDTREPVEEIARRRKTRPIERDIETVLAGLAEEFPLVASLVARRAGGQKRLPIGSIGGAGSLVPEHTQAGQAEEPQPGSEPGSVAGGAQPAPPEVEAARIDSEASRKHASVEWPAGTNRRNRARLGLSLQFENRPEQPLLGRLVESTVWVNEAHPAWRRAVVTRSEAYHLALTVAVVLVPLAAEPGQAPGFITSFLGRWGDALDKPRHRQSAARR